jgi:hypothetical protein
MDVVDLTNEESETPPLSVVSLSRPPSLSLSLSLFPSHPLGSAPVTTRPLYPHSLAPLHSHSLPPRAFVPPRSLPPPLPLPQYISPYSESSFALSLFPSLLFSTSLSLSQCLAMISPPIRRPPIIISFSLLSTNKFTAKANGILTKEVSS